MTAESTLMYDELVAVHTIMRRGTDLVTASFGRLANGEPVDTAVLVSTTRWLVDFVHHHHQSEDELFWPVLRTFDPDAVGTLDKLTADHERLDVELGELTVAVTALAEVGTGEQDRRPELARAALESARRIRDILGAHLDAEEPVLHELFPHVPDSDIVRVRKAIVKGAPRSGPHLVLGLMGDPEPAPGHAQMMSNFPAVLRLLKPALLARYRSSRRALGAGHARA